MSGSSGEPRRPAIVWSLELGPPARAEILFLRGEEDPDHMVAAIELDDDMQTEDELYAAARRCIENMGNSTFAALKSRAAPVGGQLRRMINS